MSTLQTLRTAYSDVARIDYFTISAEDMAKLQVLAQQVDSNGLSLDDARVALVNMVLGTTSVANLTYAFFTGATPSAGGLNYLISPTGGNASNLNSAYYSAFNVENRYINFAINLGKFGEGSAAFNAGYGSLDLSAATAKAYTEIFGFPPDIGKVDAILNAQVPNGVGGSFTRAEYFAARSGDGAGGIGTKAAMVGYLLAEAAKAHVGVYGLSHDAFMADLADDGAAAFNVRLTETYGPMPSFVTGATITVSSSDNVSGASTTPGLRSTDVNDFVSGANGGSSQSIATGAGNDAITFTGAFGGYIDAGDDYDTISIGVLQSSLVIPGGTPNGAVFAGAGNDMITINRVIDGAMIDGGAGEDTAIISINSNTYTQTKIVNVEHLIFKDAQVLVGGVDIGGYTGLRDVTTRSNSILTLTNVKSGVGLEMEGLTSGGLNVTYQAGVTSAEVRLDNVSSTASSPTSLQVSGAGTLVLNVLTDSALSNVSSTGPIWIRGGGHLTAAFDTVNLNASASGGVEISHIGPSTAGATTVVVLSALGDIVVADARGQSLSTYTLGAGADTFALYQNDPANIQFSNLSMSGGVVATYATITDFTKGQDVVNLGTRFTDVHTVSAGSANTLEQALANVSAQVAANGTVVFQYGGDTYIYHQDALAGVNTGDGLLKLAGATNLTVGVFGGGANILFG